MADATGIASARWAVLLSEAIRACPTAWRAVRAHLLQTSLLDPDDQIRLLRALPELWTDLAGDMDVAARLGWLCRWASRRAEEPLKEEDREALATAVHAATQGDLRSNFSITQGLRLDPERLRPRALAWIEAFPADFQTHYLLVAWLEQGLGPVHVRSAVAAWVGRHALTFHLSYLVSAWLDAGGERALVQEPIVRWLGKHAEHEAAGFVYKAWLDAGGASALVQEPIVRWLGKHAEHEAAGFVIKAWLQVGGVFPRIPIDQECIGICRLALFGSVLRDDFSPESDVDVLVEFEPGRSVGFFTVARLERELTDIFGRKADLRTIADLSRYFRDEVVSSCIVQSAANAHCGVPPSRGRQQDSNSWDSRCPPRRPTLSPRIPWTTNASGLLHDRAPGAGTDGRVDLEKDCMLTLALLRELEIISEAASRVSPGSLRGESAHALPRCPGSCPDPRRSLPGS